MSNQTRKIYTSFTELELCEAGGSMSLVLLATRDDYIDPAGTAVIIGPGLAITARHVVDHFMGNLMPEVQFLGKGMYRRGAVDPSQPRFNIVGVFISLNHPSGLMLEIDKVQMSLFSDLALMRFKMPPGEKLNHVFPRLSAWPSAVGSMIEAYGFECVEMGPPGEVTTVFKRSRGSVKSITLEKRDDGLLSYPFFETDARFDPGMSGGPVYNESGFLCGLISVGFKDEIAVTPKPYGIAASLYPLLGSSMELDIPGQPPGKLYSFKEIIGLGLVEMFGHEVFTVSYDQQTGLATDINKAVGVTSGQGYGGAEEAGQH